MYKFRHAKDVLIARRSGRDQLTGLANRYQLRRDLNSAQVRKAKLIVYVLADVDGLRRVMDNYGLAVGDRLLHEIAEQVFKGGYREGGDSFCAFATDMEVEVAKKWAESLRSRVEQLRLPGIPDLRVTARLGLVIATMPQDVDAIMRMGHDLVHCAPSDKHPNSVRLA